MKAKVKPLEQMNRCWQDKTLHEKYSGKVKDKVNTHRYLRASVL